MYTCSYIICMTLCAMIFTILIGKKLINIALSIGENFAPLKFLARFIVDCTCRCGYIYYA